MPSKFIFDRLKIKKRFCDIPFPKTLVYSDVVLDKLGQSYKAFFLSKNAES